MSSFTPIALILGAGANIGASVANVFAANGYKVILASRKAPEVTGASHSHVRADLSDPKSVPDLFSQVRKSWGEPSVVVYNAAAVSFSPDPFATDLPTFQNHLDINTTSVFMAIKEALTSFGSPSLPETASRTFIYTGNAMNFLPFAGVMTLGAGKSASAHMIASAAAAYGAKGYKFYYADERQPDGRLVGKTISGEAHAALYKTLAEDKTQEPWLQTFVKGKGFVSFPADTDVSIQH